MIADSSPDGTVKRRSELDRTADHLPPPAPGESKLSSHTVTEGAATPWRLRFSRPR